MAYRCQVVKKVKFLNDQSIYWGNQLECEFGGDRYFGNLVGMDFIMTCTCEENERIWNFCYEKIELFTIRVCKLSLDERRLWNKVCK